MRSRGNIEQFRNNDAAHYKLLRENDVWYGDFDMMGWRPRSVSPWGFCYFAMPSHYLMKSFSVLHYKEVIPGLGVEQGLEIQSRYQEREKLLFILSLAIVQRPALEWWVYRLAFFPKRLNWSLLGILLMPNPSIHSISITSVSWFVLNHATGRLIHSLQNSSQLACPFHCNQDQNMRVWEWPTIRPLLRYHGVNP